MPRVLLIGWKPGLRKVPLTKLIQAHTDLSLTAAMSCTERVLDGETVAIDLSTAPEARSFALAAEAVGATTMLDVSHDAISPVRGEDRG